MTAASRAALARVLLAGMIMAALLALVPAALAQPQPLPPLPQPGQQQPRPMPPGMQPRPGQQLPPGHPPLPQPGARPMPGGMRPGMRPVPPPEPAKPPVPEVCPGHGPMDPPHHINWYRGLIGVNNERAANPKSFVDKLLWRYENHEDHCDPKNEPPPFLANIINFGVLAFVLVRFGRKPLTDALTKRKQSIMQEIDNATRLREEAQARLKDYKKKFATLEATLAALKAEYAAQAELDKQRMLAEAEERRARMKRDAQFRIEQELKGARVSLMHEAVLGAVGTAEKLVASKATQADQDRAAEEYLATVGKTLGGNERLGAGGAL